MMEVLGCNLKDITFGADPEMFILNKKGEAVCPEKFLPGTKSEPYKVDGGALQVDGMAAEINIDPSSSFEEFNGNINKVMAELSHHLPDGYSVEIVPSMVFTEDNFLKASDEAKELGCTPDYNAWSGEVNPPPDASFNPLMRCAGGHFHIGFDHDQSVGDIQHVMNCCDLVKQLDWYLGLWSLSQDSDTLRRTLYGKAGACRIKPYGVEYRVLSNFWLKDEKLRLESWNRMVAAVNGMKKEWMPDIAEAVGRPIYGRGYSFSSKVISSINTGVISPSLEKCFTFPIKQVLKEEFHPELLR